MRFKRILPHINSIAKVQQTALRQKYHPVARGHLDHIHLIFNVGPFVVLQGRHLDFIVKVTDVSNDGHVLHLAHMLETDHIEAHKSDQLP